MRVLGIDVGMKRIGTAVSDKMGWTAQGLTTIERKEIGEDINKIKGMVEEYGCERIVVGLPKRTDGSSGPEVEKIADFVEFLKEKVNVPIILWDERFTTLMAEKTLIEANIKRKKRKEVIDKLAAVLILQSYLDTEDWKEH